MILDSFKHLKRYNIPQTEKIIAFVAKNNCLKLPNEQIDIDGKNLFVRVIEHQPKPAQENKFETHQIYADVQYIVSGLELMQVAPEYALTPIVDYDVKGDYQFYKAEEGITDLIVHTGEFTYFHPGEAHRPSCLYQNNITPVKKLVFKIKIN